MHPRGTPQKLLATAALGAVLLTLTCARPQIERAFVDVGLAIVSSRPDMISGGDALVRVTVPSGRSGAEIGLRLDGREIGRGLRAIPRTPTTSSVRATLVTLMARIEGMADGEHRLELWLDGVRAASLGLRSHPRTGPVFSGPHQSPFVCQTEANGLGPPRDSSCTAATQVSYIYKSTAPLDPEGSAGLDAEGARRARLDPTQLPRDFRPYDPGAPRPSDLAKTRLRSGAAVDYVVRRERGTINRAVYEISFLHRPGTPLPDPWTSTAGWNGRLVYVFGGGCGPGYRQGLLPGSVADDLLAAGYAVATSSLNVFGNSCNDVTSAETAMMVKEHFIVQHGPPVHTIGAGGSGGAMQQYLIAQNYPGILDAITPGVSYPDHLAVLMSSTDCGLLVRAFESSALPFDDEQKRAVSGFPTWEVCAGRWAASRLQASRCSPVVPEELQYDPVARPHGARCSMHDNMLQQLGRDPETGGALRPLDNVGVQYGLRALQAGTIGADQFLDLNERIGGYDADGDIVAERSVASAAALRAVYRGGRLNQGGGSLGSIPILDWRPYLDPRADIHDSYRSFVTWSRLSRRRGAPPANLVLLRTPSRPRQPDGSRARPPFEPVPLVDRWLTLLAVDPSPGDPASKLARARPRELESGCYTDTDEKIPEPITLDPTSRCNTLYPIHGDPRIAAGAPLTDDVLKCRLRPIDPDDYPTPLSDAQRARLEQIFPDGVCDFDQPGVEQDLALEPWRRYGGSPSDGE